MTMMLRSEALDIDIPANVTTLKAFRRWVRSVDFPERVRLAYLDGNLYVDFTMEQAFTHNLVKGCFSRVLGGIAVEKKNGYLFTDGMLLSNTDANLSTIPEAIFVTFDAIKSGRVRCIEGDKGGCVELEGSPEMTLEIISDSSELKDDQTLRELYWLARVQEYWIVDVRDDRLRFDILRHGSRGYVPARRQAGGWVRSEVFDRLFHLRRTDDELGNPQFELEVRD